MSRTPELLTMIQTWPTLWPKQSIRPLKVWGALSVPSTLFLLMTLSLLVPWPLIIVSNVCPWCHQTLFLVIFFVHFRPNFTSHSLPHLSPSCLFLLCSPPYAPYVFHAHEQTTRMHFRLVLPDTEQLVYWATNIPKQSCGGSPSPGSCAGASSATTECSHHSKFRTSRTRSTSRSASIA